MHIFSDSPVTLKMAKISQTCINILSSPQFVFMQRFRHFAVMAPEKQKQKPTLSFSQIRPTTINETMCYTVITQLDKNLMKSQLQFYLSNATETLKSDQEKRNWYENVKLNGVTMIQHLKENKKKLNWKVLSEPRDTSVTTLKHVPKPSNAQCDLVNGWQTYKL